MQAEYSDDPRVVADALAILQYVLDDAAAQDWELLDGVDWPRWRALLRNARRLLGADLQADDVRDAVIATCVRQGLA